MSKVDRIVKVFHKTTLKLIKESDRLVKKSAVKNAQANRLLDESEVLSRESLRAQRIADRLLEIVDG